MLVRVRMQMKRSTCKTTTERMVLINYGIFKSLILKIMKVTDRYAAVRKERLCSGCLGKGHTINYCKAQPCGRSGCTENHHRLLHSENQMEEGSHAVNVTKFLVFFK